MRMARLVFNDAVTSVAGLLIAWKLTAWIGLPIAVYGISGLVCLWIEAKH